MSSDSIKLKHIRSYNRRVNAVGYVMGQFGHKNLNASIQIARSAMQIQFIMAPSYLYETKVRVRVNNAPYDMIDVFSVKVKRLWIGELADSIIEKYIKNGAKIAEAKSRIEIRYNNMLISNDFDLTTLDKNTGSYFNATFPIPEDNYLLQMKMISLVDDPQIIGGEVNCVPSLPPLIPINSLGIFAAKEVPPLPPLIKLENTEKVSNIGFWVGVSDPVTERWVDPWYGFEGVFLPGSRFPHSGDFHHNHDVHGGRDHGPVHGHVGGIHPNPMNHADGGSVHSGGGGMHVTGGGNHGGGRGKIGDELDNMIFTQIGKKKVPEKIHTILEDDEINAGVQNNNNSLTSLAPLAYTAGTQPIDPAAEIVIDQNKSKEINLTESGESHSPSLSKFADAVHAALLPPKPINISKRYESTDIAEDSSIRQTNTGSQFMKGIRALLLLNHYWVNGGSFPSGEVFYLAPSDDHLKIDAFAKIKESGKVNSFIQCHTGTCKAEGDAIIVSMQNGAKVSINISKKRKILRHKSILDKTDITTEITYEFERVLKRGDVVNKIHVYVIDTVL